MSPIPELQIPLELAFHRRVLFALELLDAVTLQRVSQGVSVVANGLRGTPVVNAGGLFVWREEDFRQLRKVTIDPGILPYEIVELDAAQVQRPLTTVELPPRTDYPFSTGVTGMRGTLIESQVVPPQRPEPVRNAEVSLSWLDEDGAWQDAVTVSHTDIKGGDFASIVRLAPSERPKLDATGAITVRLRVSRPGMNDRRSAELKLPFGRITSPSTSNPLTFAWNDLLP